MTRRETSHLEAIPCLVSCLPQRMLHGNVKRSTRFEKKDEESREVKLALESHIFHFFFFFFFFWGGGGCAVQEKCFNYSKTSIFIFWYHCDAVEARKCRIGMTSSAAR